MENAVEINFNIKGLSISLEKPITLGNPRFVASNFRHAAEAITTEIEKLLVAQYGVPPTIR